MKRLLISLLCGFLIPLIYALVVAPASGYLPHEGLRHLSGLPVRWPIIILKNYVYSRWPPGSFPIKNELALMLYLIICNVALYGSLTYFILWSLKKRPESRMSPPEPPPQEI
jgi:hypothetical protein